MRRIIEMKKKSDLVLEPLGFKFLYTEDQELSYVNRSESNVYVDVRLDAFEKNCLCDVSYHVEPSYYNDGFEIRAKTSLNAIEIIEAIKALKKAKEYLENM